MNKRKGLGIVAFMLVAVFGLSAVVMLLWNYAVVAVFPIGPLNYWQALALLVLSKILLSGFRMGPGRSWKTRGGHWRGKWGHMTDEERHKLKEEWQQRCRDRKKSSGN